MPNLKDIRIRIASVKNTRKITSAMKLVAAAKLKRAQDAVEAARPYATKMTQVIDELAGFVEADAHPLLKQHDAENNILIVLVSSNRGLCGGFNGNLLRTLDRFIQDKQGVCDNIHLITVGRKGNQYYKNAEDLDILKFYEDITGNVTFEGAKALAAEAMELFKGEKVDHVYLVYNEFISAINIVPTIETILPLSASEEDEAQASSDEPAQFVEYVYEPSEQELLNQLLPNSIEVRIFQALLESEAAEQGSRMTAMDNATNNATDMIDALTLQYNRARQAYITKELVEIVSGAEALKG